MELCLTKGNVIFSQHEIVEKEENNSNKELNFIELKFEDGSSAKYFIIPPEESIDNLIFEKIKNIKYKILVFNNSHADFKKYQISYKSYKKAPKCIVNTLHNAKRVKIIKFANLIWKLYEFEKIMKLIPTLGKNQKYNHFPKTWQLGRKDNLWKSYKKFKEKFPIDYNFMPLTYIFPYDCLVIQSSKLISKHTWIVKPVASSRGRGVHLLSSMEELNTIYAKSQIKGNEYLISKYLDNPHLINNKKYDLRIYVLVTSFTPIRIYIYKEGLVRFASEAYSKENKDNIYIHLTNYSINKNNLNYRKGKEDPISLSDTSKWSLTQYANYFKSINKERDHQTIFLEIKDMIIKTILSTVDENLRVLRGILKQKNSLFEVYGFDILVDDKLKPWLIEVNVCPSLNCDTSLDFKIKSELIRDTINTIGISTLNDKNNDPEFGIKFKQALFNFKIKVCKTFNVDKNSFFTLTEEESFNLKQNPEYREMCNYFTGELLRSNLGNYELLFPNYINPKSSLYYSQFIQNPGDDNILLWKWLNSK